MSPVPPFDAIAAAALSASIAVFITRIFVWRERRAERIIMKTWKDRALRAEETLDQMAMWHKQLRKRMESTP